MDKVRVGKILNTFGLHGELKTEIITDFPEERFQKGKTLIVFYDGKEEHLIVKSVRYHKNNALLLFEGLEDINLVEKYKGLDLFISTESIEPLDDGFYTFELIDLDVYADGKKIGTVAEVESYPAQTILRVKKEDGEFLLPFVDAFVEEVDLDNRRIDIVHMEGLY